MASSPDPRKNHLLEPVDMPLGEVLYESGMTMTHVYFPTTSIVSLLYVMGDGASAEIAVVGNEGIVGISLFMGGETTPSRSVVQSAGQGFRMRGQLLKDEFNRSGPVLHLLLRYTQANLQRAGLIRYRRGHITVLDRQGLEQRTCECYAVVRKEYERLLPGVAAP
jgi:CRP-like cAMP-binding protein